MYTHMCVYIFGAPTYRDVPLSLRICSIGKPLVSATSSLGNELKRTCWIPCRLDNHANTMFQTPESLKLKRD